MRSACCAAAAYHFGAAHAHAVEREHEHAEARHRSHGVQRIGQLPGRRGRENALGECELIAAIASLAQDCPAVTFCASHPAEIEPSSCALLGGGARDRRRDPCSRARAARIRAPPAARARRWAARACGPASATDRASGRANGRSSGSHSLARRFRGDELFELVDARRRIGHPRSEREADVGDIQVRERLIEQRGAATSRGEQRAERTARAARRARRGPPPTRAQPSVPPYGTTRVPRILSASPNAANAAAPCS